MAKRFAFISMGILCLAIAGQLFVSSVGAARKTGNGIVGVFDHSKVMLADGTTFDVSSTGFTRNLPTGLSAAESPIVAKDIKRLAGGFLETKQGAVFTILHRKGNWQQTVPPISANQIKFLDGRLLVSNANEVWISSGRQWIFMGTPTP